MKKFLSVFLTIVLFIGAIVGTVYLCQKNNDKRSLKIDEGFEKEIVFVIDKGDTEKKETDITKLKYVNVGDTIKIADSFEGEVFVGKKADVKEGCAGIVISGVEKVADKTYVVIDNVEIGIVANPETISPVPSK